MTEQQVKWAQTHDWFHESDWLDPETRCITVINRFQDTDGSNKCELCVFTDFAALREWAGY